MESFDAKTLILWNQYSNIRSKQIARWLEDAREVRGAEFTPAKEAAWLTAELGKDTHLRLSLQVSL